MQISNQKQSKIIYLAQTDTTVGFLSDDKIALAKAKNRNIKQPFLMCVDSFKKQKKLVRSPKKYKNFIRRSNKTSFIYSNKKAIRVVKDEYHIRFLKNFNFLYSSSANLSSKNFDKEFAYKVADVIVIDKRDIYENRASTIYKLSKNKIVKIR